MKGMSAHLDIIGCGPETTGHPGYFVATALRLSIEYHETPPVTAGIICSLNK